MDIPPAFLSILCLKALGEWTIWLSFKSSNGGGSRSEAAENFLKLDIIMSTTNVAHLNHIVSMSLQLAS